MSEKMIYTTVLHSVRRKLELSFTEYCVLDAIHQLSRATSKHPGWCFASKSTLAKNMELGERQVYDALTKLEEKGLIERKLEADGISGHVRATDRWYSARFGDDTPLRKTQGVPLRKPHPTPAENADNKTLHSSSPSLQKEKPEGGEAKAPPAQPQADPTPPKPLTPIQKVVLAFKEAQGVDRKDKEWDRVYFARFSRSARDILNLVGGDVELARNCVRDLVGWFKRKGLDWMPETLVKHAGKWKAGTLDGVDERSARGLNTDKWRAAGLSPCCGRKLTEPLHGDPPTCEGCFTEYPDLKFTPTVAA